MFFMMYGSIRLAPLPLVCVFLLLQPVGVSSATEPGEATAADTRDSTATVTAEQELRKYASPELIQKLKNSGISIPMFLQAFKWAIHGVKAYRKGEFGEALHYLRKAYAAVRSPMPLYWMGRTYEAFGDGAKAALHFERFLKLSEAWELTHIKDRYLTDARGRLARLGQELVRLHLEVTPDGAEVLVNGTLLKDVDDRVVKSPFTDRIWLNPGVNVLLITRKGHLTYRLVLSASPGTELHRSVKLLTPGEYVKQSEQYRRMLEERRRLRAKIEKERRDIMERADSKKRLYSIVGYSLETAGAVMLGGSTVLGWMAYDAKDSIESVPDGARYWHDYSDQYDDFYVYRNATAASVAVGAALVAGGWYVLRLRDAIKPKLPPLPAPLPKGNDSGNVIQGVPSLHK